MEVRPADKRQKREAQRREDQKGAGASLPRKKLYRQRAHANPFSDHKLTYPQSPQLMDWTVYYPAFASTQTKEHSPRRHDDDDDDNDVHDTTTYERRLTQEVEVADIGCGFGGLLVALAPRMPETILLGLEIRSHVAEFVQERIRALRAQNAPTSSSKLTSTTSTTTTTTTTTTTPSTTASNTKSKGLYSNIACVRANTMKFMPNFFAKGQLSKIFLCFPDPHFKARKHKARIVSPTLNAEYAYVLRPGGIVYTITDVEDLHMWMTGHFDAHASFEKLTQAQLDADECVAVMQTETEEGKKVDRNQGPKFVACFRRLLDPEWP
ncbi:MAG: hypothetical protein M1825_004132 [Sarcosagium campestre]|nr:MAG: hypothetical protein M1825_004132 [Sarcosagium campestre]